VGFCSPSGSLGLQYGVDELSRIDAVIPKIRAAMKEATRRHLVRSEYSAGQFADGDLEHPLANLCVPNANNDCDILEPLSTIDYHSSIVKQEQSAISSPAFCSEIERDINIGIKNFVLSGFLFEHCVTSTALDLVSMLADSGAEVVVCRDLVASRVQKYSNGIVDQAADELINNGVKIQLWHELRYS
jgi:nicotinamidase-related amidase